MRVCFGSVLGFGFEYLPGLAADQPASGGGGGATLAARFHGASRDGLRSSCGGSTPKDAFGVTSGSDGTCVAR